jgi:uncharacterized repeat protein (TIGR01451 family)/uncharacterized repeat protein (TIGR02543 family)
VLTYNTNSGLQAGFTGAINTANVGTGSIAFNGANATGATGNSIVLTLTFDVVAAGTSALNLEYSAMAAATTFTSLLPILTVNDGSVTVPAQYTLTVAVNPTAGGTTDPAVGAHTYAPGTVVTVTATPAAGYAFTSWSGACTGSGACSVTMDADKTVTANFTLINYNLTVAVDPVGGGTTDPAVGVHSYSYGTVVDVTATPAAGFAFVSWSGACTGSGACQVTMDGDKTVTATFAGISVNLTVEVSPTGGGTTVPAAGVHAYAYGVVANVTATPAGGFVFSSWSGACTGSGPCSVTMDADKTVTANFTELAPDLSLTKTTEGEGVRAGGTLVYELTYDNAGGTATGVVINETVPANTTFNAAASTAGWTCSPNGNAGSTCTFNIGEVANADSDDVTFAVTVAVPLSASVTAISNTAGITDDGSHGEDSNPANNTATVQIPINRYLNYLPLIFKN